MVPKGPRNAILWFILGEVRRFTMIRRIDKAVFIDSGVATQGLKLKGTVSGVIKLQGTVSRVSTQGLLIRCAWRIGSIWRAPSGPGNSIRCFKAVFIDSRVATPGLLLTQGLQLKGYSRVKTPGYWLRGYNSRVSYAVRMTAHDERSKRFLLTQGLQLQGC